MKYDLTSDADAPKPKGKRRISLKIDVHKSVPGKADANGTSGLDGHRPRTSTPRSASSINGAGSQRPLSSAKRGPRDTALRQAMTPESTEPRTKKNVFFSSNAVNGSSDSSESENEKNVRTQENGVRKKTAMSPQSNPLSPRFQTPGTHQEDHSARPRSRQARSASAHATRTRHDSDKTETPARKRSVSRGRLTSMSDEPKTPVPNGTRGRKSVEKLRLRSTSSDSLSSDSSTSPRVSSRQLPPTPSTASTANTAALAALTEAQKQAWENFETHVKLIDDSTELIFRQQRKTFNSSGAFQRVMRDMYGNTEYGKSRAFMRLKSRVANIATCATRFLAKARRAKEENESNRESVDDDLDDDFDDMDYHPSRETIENARRGWRILRQYVQEMAAEKRMSQSTLTWNMLRHTLKGMSNMERARRDLYQRYGIVPMITSDGKVIQENTMLSQRARSALANKPRNPTMTRFHSATTRRPTKAIDGFRGTLFVNDTGL